MNLQHAWQTFIDNAFPTKKNEYWKQVDVSHLKNIVFADAECTDQAMTRPIFKKESDVYLLVFLDGEYLAGHSDTVPHLVIKKENSHTHQKINLIKYPFAQFNLETTDTTVIHINDQVKLDKPIHLLHVTEHPVFTQTKINIHVGEHASVHVIQEFISHHDKNYFHNICMNLEMKKNSHCVFEKFQNESIHATHLSTLFVTQAEKSETLFNFIAHGAMLSRDDLVVELMGQDAICKTHGAYKLKRDKQCVDYHIDIQHKAKHTTSQMLFKGVVAARAKAIFNGRLYVEKNTQSISATQNNHHLLLSDFSESFAKPELEIYSDDIKCQHGVSCGQLDEDALFYLKSRGVAHLDAIDMLISGFMNEVLTRIHHPSFRQQAEACLT